MILGIGVDLVSINRFDHWVFFSEQRLGRVFHAFELKQLKLAEQKTVFLASRFAVKEASFKALSAALGQQMIPFLSFAPLVCVQHDSRGVPRLCIDHVWWQPFEAQGIRIHLSLTHEKTDAIAYVIVDQ